MSGSKYYDAASVVQVIGCLMKQPRLMEDDGTHFFTENDFTNEFHKTVFGCIYNMYTMGAEKINFADIENYCSVRPKAKAIYEAHRGSAWLKEAMDAADTANFDYYYSRMKKMSLLRGYESCGMDVSFLYDPNEIFDEKKKERQENNLNAMSLDEIADEIDNKIFDTRARFVDNSTDDIVLAGDGIFDLIDRLHDEPDVGSPLYGGLINTVTRGARLGKFYVRSAATGVGKTRTMIADAATIAYDEIYENGKWVKNGICEPVLFISTEMEMDEVQTMLLAFVGNVDENKIKTGTYDFEEKARIDKAAQIISKQPLYVEIIPDFNLRDIENIIKRSIRMYGVKYVMYDYLHTSMKILEEISHRSGGVKLREDNILFLLSVKLKELCTKFNVFILTATQLNGEKK